MRAESKLTTLGKVSWSAGVGGTTEAGKGSLPGPAALSVADIRSLVIPPKKDPEKTSAWWRFIFGAGAARALDDHEIFKVEGDALLLKNDSNWRTTAIIGVAFRTRKPARGLGKRILPNEMTVAVDFAANTTKDLDGVTLGVVWTLQPYLGFMAGGRLRRGEELSPGFRRAAALHVAAQQASSDEATRKLYQRFTLNEDGSDSHNFSLIFGIVVPLQFSLAPK